MKTLIILILFLVGCSNNTKVIDKEEDDSEVFDCVVDEKRNLIVCYTQKRVENA